MREDVQSNSLAHRMGERTAVARFWFYAGQKLMLLSKTSRLGSELGVFSQQLENPGFKVPCCFGCCF
jgi:hypothetical protein